MSLLRNVMQTGFRLFPWSTEPGLRAIGQPDSSSPVLVTGNYDFTVRSVIRALKGMDAWLVVAPSSGINIWCAAAGGHFSTHQVVSALKTSGIEDRVTHRRAILPQLAATGVEAREVSRRCGWKVRFGPVDAVDIPRYLARGAKKDDAMRRVRFGTRERLEMAAAWATPTAIVVGGVGAFAFSEFALPIVIWAVVLAITMFQFYDRLPEPRRTLFTLLATAVAALVVLCIHGGPSTWAAAFLSTWFLSGVLTFDYSGSTPIEGGSHFAEREWRISLDRDRCQGVFSCWEVCPEACFEKQSEPRKAILAHDDRCVRCGACVVQCPMDALAFESTDGQRIAPETIRRYKLNLLGKRTVQS